MPEVTREDLSLLDGPAITARGLVRLPATLEAALACFSRDHTVMGWFAEPFQDVYLAHKAAEMQYVRDMSETEIYSLYEVVY